MKANSDVETLRAMMARANLSRGAVADLLHVSRHTVDHWFRVGGHPVPLWAVELFEFKTGYGPRQPQRQR